MTASRAEAERLLAGVIRDWIADPDSAVEYSEDVDGRTAVRMRQQTRDFSTVWFQLGERSLQAEAYVIPAGERPVELLRQCLVRNMSTWRTRFCLDRENGIVLRARVALDQLDARELEYLMAEIYDQIEVSFRPLVRALSTDAHRSPDR